MASEPRRPSRPPKVVLDEAAKNVAKNVAEAYAQPRRPRKKKSQPLDPPKSTVKVRPQQEPVDTPTEGITYGGKCARCEQVVRVHIKTTEGQIKLMNFYSVRCPCKGTISIHRIGPADHNEFAHLDPNHPNNQRIDSVDGVGK